MNTAALPEASAASLALDQADREADQLAFFDALDEGFRRASVRVEIIDRDFLIAGFRIRLRFAGPALCPVIVPAIAHLETAVVGAADLTIALFDCRSTGTRLPFLADRFVDLLRLRWWEWLAVRREIKDLHGGRIRSVFHLGPDILSLLDTARDQAIYWVDDAASIPYYESGYPLTVLLNWWLSQHRRYFVHAAIMGLPSGGVMLTGKGGSGKSTTTLACVFSELGIVSDDYAVVDPDAGVAYSLYNTIKLKGLRDLERFPGLADYVCNLERVAADENDPDGEKAMIFLHQYFPERLLDNLPLKAILVPHIHDQAETTFAPVSAAVTFKALAPSTLFQLPGNAHDAFAGLVQMVRRIPSYEVALGHDIAGIPGTIERFIKQL